MKGEHKIVSIYYNSSRWVKLTLDLVSIPEDVFYNSFKMTKLFNYIFILNLIIFLSIKNIVAKENLVTDMSENSVEISSTF